jgi:NAD(P)-dependent dehydrogenase (short-subunit alcohol dehydrogenase family)
MKTNRNLAYLAFGAAAGGAILLARSAAKQQRTFDFRGKTVLITGGSRGLGLVLARQFAAEGARIAICARNSEELDAARQDIETHGGEVASFVCDLGHRDEVKRMVMEVIARFGAVDVLINNAGTITVGPVETMTIDDYHYSMDTIYWAAVHTAYYLVPHMQERGGGRIVNIGSVGGKVGVPHLSPYCAAKFAVTGWSRAIQGELRRHGIYVTTISPGLMRTGSPRQAQFKSQHEKEYAWFKISDSLPVISMSAEEAAAQIIDATRKGAVDVTLGLPARIAVIADNLMPDVTGEVAAVAARFLPGVGGGTTRSITGAESESPISENPLTRATDDAARQNNELFAPKI